MMTNQAIGRTAGLCALLLVMTAPAIAVELDVTLMRDVVYQPERDSVVQPAAVAIGAGFTFGSIGSIQARLGGSGYWTQVLVVENYHLEGSDVREALESAWLQVIPGVRVPLFYRPLTAYGGVGLGGRNSAEHRLDSDYGDELRWHDRSVWAFDQTFVLGLGFELSKRFDLNLEAQRAGFTVSSELIRRYTSYPPYQYVMQEQRQDVFRAGWRKSAATGLGIGLRVKL